MRSACSEILTTTSLYIIIYDYRKLSDLAELIFLFLIYFQKILQEEL